MLFGEEISGYSLDLIERALEKAAKEILKNHNRLFIEKLEAGSFAVLLEQVCLDLDGMPDLALSFRLFVRNSLNQQSVQLTGQRLEICSGYAFIRGYE